MASNKKVKILLQTPRGTKDILPEEQKYWRFITRTIEEAAESFGYSRIETPIFEYRTIFDRAIGSNTDIVQKQMYEVSRLGESKIKPPEEQLVLKPEGTAGIIRAYIEHGMQTLPQPVRLYYISPSFRYERPQAGRSRIFYQFGVEVIGDDHPATDASVIMLLWQVLEKLQITKNLVTDINSVGCRQCRGKLKSALVSFYQKRLDELCEICQVRFSSNPLRLLDCKEEKCQKVARQAPQLIDNLCPECKTHLKQLLEILDELNLPYNLNPWLVRGLDYYTRTVFEVINNKDTARQAALAGGGRYNDLVELYGGAPTPAFGFGAGIERIIERIKDFKVEVPEIARPQILVIHLGDQARKQCLPLVARLSEIGLSSTCATGKESLKSQLKTADRMGAPIALIIGQREVYDKTVILRDMNEGTQETLILDDLDEVLRQKLNIELEK